MFFVSTPKEFFVFICLGLAHASCSNSDTGYRTSSTTLSEPRALSDDAEDKSMFGYYGTLPIYPSKTFRFTGNSSAEPGRPLMLDLESSFPQPIVFDHTGTGYLSSTKGSLLKIKDGELLKEIPLGSYANGKHNAIPPSAVISRDLVVVSIGTSVFWIEKDEIKYEFKNRSDMIILTAPSVLSDNSVAVVSREGLLILKNGQLIGSYKTTPNVLETSSPVILHDDTIVFSYRDTTIPGTYQTTTWYRKGAVKNWSLRIGVNSSLRFPAATIDGTIVINSALGQIIQLKDGNVLGSSQRHMLYSKGFPDFFRDGTIVYLKENSRSLYFYKSNFEPGNVTFKPQIPAYGQISRPTIMDNGTVIYGIARISPPIPSHPAAILWVKDGVLEHSQVGFEGGDDSWNQISTPSVLSDGTVVFMLGNYENTRIYWIKR